MHGIDTGIARDYISKHDKDVTKTVWKLGILSPHAFAYVSSKVAEPSKAVEGMIEVVRFGLLGFDNFVNAQGVAIEFHTKSKPMGQHNYNVVADDIIDVLPIKLIMELSEQILEKSNLSEQVRKN